MKLRAFFTILIAGVFILLSLSGGAFYWLFTHTPLNLLQGGPITTPSGAMFVSKNSPLMMSLLVNPDRVEALNQVFTPPKQRAIAHSEFNQIKQSLLTNTDFNYGRDIQPWLGNEITFAVTNYDFDRDNQNGQKPGLLLAMASKNPVKSQDFLEVYWQKRVLAGEDIIFEPYKGVKIIYKKPDSFLDTLSKFSPDLATAIVNKFVLFANDPKVLRNAINNLQAVNWSLNNAPEYQRTLGQLEGGRVGLIYLNFNQLTNLITQAKPSNQEEIESPLSSILTLALATQKEGLLAQTALLAPANPQLPKVSLLAKPVKALQYIPPNSFLVAASSNLNQLWQAVSTGLSDNDILEKIVTQTLADLKITSGIDLPEDIFSWVKGEYALALLPRLEQKQTDVIFVAEKSDESPDVMKKLNAIAQEKGYSIGSFNLEDQTISAWTQLTTNPVNKSENPGKTNVIKTEAKAVHATVDNYEIFTTSVTSIADALKAAKTVSFASNTNFAKSGEVLPPENHGYFYLDWAESHGSWERQFPLLRLVELSAKPFFDHLRSISLTSIDQKDGIRRASALIKLQ